MLAADRDRDANDAGSELSAVDSVTRASDSRYLPAQCGRCRQRLAGMRHAADRRQILFEFRIGETGKQDLAMEPA